MRPLVAKGIANKIYKRLKKQGTTTATLETIEKMAKLPPCFLVHLMGKYPKLSKGIHKKRAIGYTAMIHTFHILALDCPVRALHVFWGYIPITEKNTLRNDLMHRIAMDYLPNKGIELPE